MGANIKARRRRLLVLADFLEAEVLPMLDGAKFDMDTWAASNDKRPGELGLGEASECGFTGCALGWGLLSPRLRKAGIADTVRGEVRCRCPACSIGRDHAVDFNRERARDFFGLAETEFTTAFLGVGRGRRGVVAVVKRLRKIAATEVPA